MEILIFFCFQPSSQIEKQPPDNSEFHLLDRVVNVRDNFVIPLGARGTVIGQIFFICKMQYNNVQINFHYVFVFLIAGIEKPSPDTGLMYCDILLDQPIQSAMQYNTKKKRVYKFPDRCLLNISHAKRIREKDEPRKGNIS